METNKTVGCAIQSVITLTIFIGAFLTYDAKSALVVLFVLSTLNLLASLLGFIPVVGVFLYWLLSKKIIFAKFFIWFPEIEPSWLTTVIFWSGLVFAISLTFITIATIVNKRS